jgi:hypothetical protein
VSFHGVRSELVGFRDRPEQAEVLLTGVRGEQELAADGNPLADWPVTVLASGRHAPVSDLAPGDLPSQSEARGHGWSRVKKKVVPAGGL